eukprot:2242248-Rhodomonas_salina.1
MAEESARNETVSTAEREMRTSPVATASCHACRMHATRRAVQRAWKRCVRQRHLASDHTFAVHCVRVRRKIPRAAACWMRTATAFLYSSVAV